MNSNSSETMIDEEEIRAALRPSRFEPEAFRAGVLNRIEAAKSRSTSVQPTTLAEHSHSSQNEWLRIAASFVPIPLFGSKFGSTIPPISFAAISISKKLFVIAAFPFLCFLMVGLTVVGMIKIRRAQNGSAVVDFDVEQANQVIMLWWKRYGWIVVLVFGSTLVAPFVGWAMPLMVAMVCSGFAAVSLVRTLAKEGLIERSLIGGLCTAGLGLLAQASNTLSSNSSQILDPNLVMGVLFGGAVLIGAAVRPIAWTKPGDLNSLRTYSRESLIVWFLLLAGLQMVMAYWLESIVPLIAIGITGAIFVYALVESRLRTTDRTGPHASAAMILVTMTLVFTQSYWRGVTDSDIQKYVESYDGVPFGLWDYWADSASWLNDSETGFDKRATVKHLKQAIKREPPTSSDWILAAAARAGLESEPNLLMQSGEQAFRLQLANPDGSTTGDQPILSLESEYFRIVSSIDSSDLTTSERQTIVNRLMATWRRLDSDDVDYRRLRNAMWLTELFDRLDSTHQIERRRSDVHEWLVDRQVTEPKVFRKGGGFYVTSQSIDSDRRETLAAVRLMETYGVPPGLNLMQLRSYLRPDFIYDSIKAESIPKKIAMSRLDRILAAPRPTVFDYLRSELPLWLSIFLVVLLAYATWTSPKRQSIDNLPGA
jgi:hypothetical protein